MAPLANNATVNRGSAAAKARDFLLLCRVGKEVESLAEIISGASGTPRINIDIVSMIRQCQRVWDLLQVVPVGKLSVLEEEIQQYEGILHEVQWAIDANAFTTDSPSLGRLSEKIEGFVRNFEMKLHDICPSPEHPGTNTARTSFFQHAHNIVISGGSFTAVSNPPDSEQRVQNKKMLLMQYINLGVLFVYTGHSERL